MLKFFQERKSQTTKKLPVNGQQTRAGNTMRWVWVVHLQDAVPICLLLMTHIPNRI